MKRALRILLLSGIAATLVTGCTNNILLTKNGERYFLASKEQGLKKLLCDSGDMQEILQATKLQQPIKESLTANICTDKPSKEKIMEVLSGMTREEREDLKFSFWRHGYDVNIVLC
ncbi:MAG TPA: hypothetical protein VFR01_03560 [Geobacterales bacterium]|nr:hypothetical protein [Geobacterales bacterium]